MLTFLLWLTTALFGLFVVGVLADAWFHSDGWHPRMHRTTMRRDNAQTLAWLMALHRELAGECGSYTPTGRMPVTARG
jgi:hypothetical protein